MRQDKDERRNLNIEEMQSMVFTEMSHFNEEDGWPYPDYDDPDYDFNDVPEPHDRRASQRPDATRWHTEY